MPLNFDDDEMEEDVNIISIFEIDRQDWRQPLINYIENGKLPNDTRHRTEIRRQAPQFVYYKNALYRRLFDGLLLR